MQVATELAPLAEAAAWQLEQPPAEPSRGWVQGAMRVFSEEASCLPPASLIPPRASSHWLRRNGPPCLHRRQAGRWRLPRGVHAERVGAAAASGDGALHLLCGGSYGMQMLSFACAAPELEPHRAGINCGPDSAAALDRPTQLLLWTGG